MQTGLLAVMGSGETSPTMVGTHREVFAAVEGVGGPAVLLDTPFGFQDNADELTARALRYFADSVGRPVEVASYRRAGTGDRLAAEAAFARIATARWVFAGPGSPTYALRQWRGSPVPGLLAGVLARGGCLVFASAAALTLGVVTVPVYEVYKCGEDPYWLDGLDLLGPATGLSAAVIPHYDNAEGGTHDTRYCYLGERRLRPLEQRLPAGAFVLGVDEHTAALVDLGAGTVTVRGRAGVTVRRDGRSRVLPADSVLPVPALAAGASAPGAPVAVGPPAAAPTTEAPSLGAQVAAHRREFDAALDRRDVPAAVRAVLALEEALHAWSSDTLQSADADQGRAALRTMVVRLGELAAAGVRDPRELLRPFVDELVALRATARAQRRYTKSDRLRDRLTALGVDLRDTLDGTEWRLAD